MGTYGGIIRIAIMVAILFAGKQWFSQNDADKADSSSSDSADSQTTPVLMEELQAKIERASAVPVAKAAASPEAPQPQMNNPSCGQPRAPGPQRARIPRPDQNVPTGRTIPAYNWVFGLRPKPGMTEDIVTIPDQSEWIRVVRCERIVKKEDNIELVAFLFKNMILFTKEVKRSDGPGNQYNHFAHYNLTDWSVEKSKTNSNVKIHSRKKRLKSKWSNFKTFDGKEKVENEEWIRLVNEQKRKP